MEAGLSAPGTRSRASGCLNILEFVSKSRVSLSVKTWRTTKALWPTRQSPSPTWRSGKLGSLCGREADQAAGVGRFGCLLLVDDLGRAVGEKSLRESPGLGVGVADGVEIGEPVDDHEVGDPQAA